MQQQIDAGGYTEKAADQENSQIAPIDCTPECGNAEQLNRDAANDHHVDGVDGAVHQVKQQGTAQRRERESGDTGDGGSHENRDQGKGDTMDTLRRQQRTLRDQEAEAKNPDDDQTQRARIGGKAEPELAAVNKLFWHLSRACAPAPPAWPSSTCKCPVLWMDHRDGLVADGA
jgi:hypothetical protein